MGSIPTGAEWKLLRQNTYNLPKGVGPSLGKTLDAYHTTKKKLGAEAGVKALKVVKEEGRQALLNVICKNPLA